MIPIKSEGRIGCAVKKAKISVSAAAALLMTFLCGCSFGTSIDNLMTPPKLSVEQEQIYSALTDAAGSSISLKYPKSGTYLSAFIVEDIDGDGGSEAVVFYEKTGLTVEENTLRINILDQSDGKWRSVCDTPADGSEIEKVMISKLGSNSRVNLIIGSSLINRSEKTVSIYNYSDGNIEKTFSSSYSFIDVTDLDKDEENEFLLLSGSASDAPAAAESYKLDEQGMYHKYSCELSGSFTAFDSIVYGEIGGDRTGLYIDAVTGTGLIQTDIVYMDESGLNKVFANPEESLSTVRPSGFSSYDADGDGILEIPVQTISPGYEEVSESEQMKLTNLLFINDENKLKQKYSSYFSINDGYTFIFPDKWHKKVTVKRDAINDEIVFCAYENNQIGRELLRICCAEDSVTREDRISAGYMLLSTKGESSYLAYIPASDAEDGLSLSAADMAVYFKLKK
ncbi:MAG: hypothetical protein IJX77_07245 [Ruminococcus sp.]|nr:hypothetical protein [Ruminococcus sp.]